MKNWLDMPMNRQRLAWGMGAGLMAMMLMLLAVVWLNSLSVLPGQALLVRPQVLAALGWPASALLALELALGFGFGVSVGLAVPPMRERMHLDSKLHIFSGRLFFFTKLQHRCSSDQCLLDPVQKLLFRKSGTVRNKI